MVNWFSLRETGGARGELVTSDHVRSGKLAARRTKTQVQIGLGLPILTKADALLLGPAQNSSQDWQEGFGARTSVFSEPPLLRLVSLHSPRSRVQVPRVLLRIPTPQSILGCWFPPPPSIPHGADFWGARGIRSPERVVA